MAAESETRLATLEQLVHEQAVTIASQASALSEQSRTIDELAAESRTFGGVTRSYERALLELTKFIFPGGLWVEKGTIGRQARSSQAWANGEEGGKEWEWQSFNLHSTNHFATLAPELLTMIFELCGISGTTEWTATLRSLCLVSSRFLAVAGRLLYREIKIDGRGAQKLFCTRTDAQRAPDHRVGQCLSFSHTLKITLESGWSPAAIVVHNDRIDRIEGSEPRLRISAVSLKTSSPAIDIALWDPVLALLDPRHLKIHGERQDQFRFPLTCDMPANGCPFFSGWTRLVSVSFIGAVVFVFVENGKPDRIALIPPAHRLQNCHVEYEIHQVPKTGAKTIDCLGSDMDLTLATLREGWTAKVGMWTYLRAFVVGDVVAET